MENTPLDQSELSTSEPTSPAPAPSPMNPSSATRKRLFEDIRSTLGFLLGLVLGIIPLIITASIHDINARGGACLVSAIGLLIVGLAIALNLSRRWLAFGLMVGFMVSFPVSCSTYVNSLHIE